MKKIFLFFSVILLSGTGCTKNSESSAFNTEIDTHQPITDTTTESTGTPKVFVDMSPSDTIDTIKNQNITKKDQQKMEIEKIESPQNQDKSNDLQIEQQIEEKTAILEAQKKAIQDALNADIALKKQQAEEVERQAQQEAAQKAAIIQRQIEEKQALLDQMKTECDNPINTLTQKILDIKTKYFVDLNSLSGQGRAIPMALLEGQRVKLLNDANTKIQDLSNQIDQIKLGCSTKF